MTKEEYQMWKNETIISGGAWFNIGDATQRFFMPLKSSNGKVVFETTQVLVENTRHPPYQLHMTIGDTEHCLACTIRINPEHLEAGTTVTLFELEIGYER